MATAADLKPLPGIPKFSRGTYIQVVELSRPTVIGESVLAPGQSEDPASPHYADQRELASWWLYKPMITDRAALEKE
jgi:acyl-homoserine lactone acylase PvdQ